MIIRTKKYERFTVLNNELIENKNLDWDALGLLVFLLSKMDNWQVRPKILAQQRKAGEHTIRRLLKNLRDAGYVVLQRHQSGEVDWLVYDVPQVIEKQPDNDFPKLGKSPISKFTNSENHDTIVNKDLKQTNLEFIYFWEIYPVKRNSAAAEHEWKLLSDQEKRAAIETVAAFLKSLPSWQTIPYPASYLNQRRWLDDLSPPVKSQPSQPSHGIRLPRSDANLESWAKKNDLPSANIGEEYYQYRARLTQLIESRNNHTNE